MTRVRIPERAGLFSSILKLLMASEQLLRKFWVHVVMAIKASLSECGSWSKNDLGPDKPPKKCSCPLPYGQFSVGRCEVLPPWECRGPEIRAGSRQKTGSRVGWTRWAASSRTSCRSLPRLRWPVGGRASCSSARVRDDLAAAGWRRSAATIDCLTSASPEILSRSESSRRHPCYKMNRRLCRRRRRWATRGALRSLKVSERRSRRSWLSVTPFWSSRRYLSSQGTELVVEANISTLRFGKSCSKLKRKRWIAT